MTDLLPYALPAVAGLLALLLAVDRWAERFNAWVEGKHCPQRPKPRNP